MLRFLMRAALYLLIAFAGIGLLVSREWGWSEYDSNALYLLYVHLKTSAPSPFFLINTDGSNKQWKLSARDGALHTASCSPDGRTLAYLTDAGDLTVVNESGVLYQRALGLGYDTLATANNGTVAVSKREFGITLVVTPNDSFAPAPPDLIAYDPIKISSSGDTLWSHTAQGGIKLVAPSGETVISLASGASAPSWLADERLFTFAYTDGREGSTGGIVDSSHRLSAEFRHSIIPYSLLSPDARLAVVRFVNTGSSHEQLYVVDALTSRPKRQLTNDEDFHLPICFLTFRPEMLISPS